MFPMELEEVIAKEKSRKVVVEDLSITKFDPKEVPQNNFSRTHVPNVFEHQYAEYISGLKPPYLSVGKGRKDEKYNQL